MNLSDKEKIELFDSVWKEIEPKVKEQVSYALRSQVEREMQSVVKGYTKTYVIEIVKPFLASQKESIVARVEKKSESALTSIIDSLPEHIKWICREDFETAIRNGLKKTETEMWRILERIAR